MSNCSKRPHIETPPGSLTIETVRACRERWMELARSPDDVAIDLSGVTECDTAGLQLLLSFGQTLKGDGRTLTWLNPSETVSESARALGLDLHALMAVPAPESL